jgi:hypothetical protein
MYRKLALQFDSNNSKKYTEENIPYHKTLFFQPIERNVQTNIPKMISKTEK